MEEEQLEIFVEIRSAESKLKKLLKSVEDAKIPDLVDETAAFMRYMEPIDDEKSRLFFLMRKAVGRGYHENGLIATRQIDKGVETKINLRKFFLDRKSRYNLESLENFRVRL